VFFKDGSKETFDVIIEATGYTLSFPFIHNDLVEIKHNVPQIPFGVFHPKYKGLYLVGWNRAAYGIGALMSKGARQLCEIIKLQDNLSHPVGEIFEKMGVLPFTEYSTDPVPTLKVGFNKKLIDELPAIEKFLFPN